MIALLLLAAVTPEAADLGRQLASSGMLATLAPLKTSAEIEEIVKDHPELGDADKAAFRASAKAIAERLRTRVIDVAGAAYASSLSIADLRTLAAFAKTDAAKRQRAAMPAIIMQTMKGMGEIDFKGSAMAEFCKTSGKLCAVPK